MVILAEQASNLATDTSLLEAKHASIRRLLLSASMQTHALAHPQLSARWVLTQCRRRGRKRTATKVIRKRPGPNEKKGRRKRGTGFMTKKGNLKQAPRGGVQRAFVRLTSLGTRGSPDVSEVARRFREHRAAGTPLFHSAQSLAEAAKKRIAAGVGGGIGAQTFGLKARQIRRTQMQALADALSNRTLDMNTDDRRMIATRTSLAQAGNLPEALRLARSSDMSASRCRRNAEAAAALQLQEWQASQEESLQSIQQYLPEQSGANLELVPFAGGVRCVDCTHRHLASVTAGVAWAVCNYRTSPLAAAMEQDWQLNSELLKESDCEAIPAAALAMSAADQSCYKAGMCVCAGKGKSIQDRVNSLLAHMRRLFPRASYQRAMGVSGHVVVRLVGKGGVLDDDGEVDLLASLDASASVYWHIGLLYLSPFRPTFMKVNIVEGVNETEPTPERMYIESANEFATVHQALAHYADCSEIDAEFWVLEECSRPIPGPFRLRPVPMVRMRDMEASVSVWPRRRRDGGKKFEKKAGAAAEEGGGEGRGEECDDDDGRGGDGDEGAGSESDDEEPLAEVGLAADMLLAMYEGRALVAMELPPPLPPPLGEPPLPEARPVVVGGASSSSGAAPPPAPMRAAAADIQRGQTSKALAVVYFPGGSTIAFYKSGTFLASCKCKNHGRCTKTRQGRGASGKGPTMSGRPLGFLAAWLLVGYECEDRAQHYSPESIYISFDTRSDARAQLRRMPGADALLECEGGSPDDPEPAESF